MRHAADLADLLLAGIGETARLVRDTHAAVARTSFDAIARVPPLRAPARLVQLVERGIAGAVYGTIGLTADAAAAAARALATRIPEPVDRAELEAGPAVAAGILNGAVGDVLARRGNGLALEMTLRHRGRRLSLSAGALTTSELRARERLCVFVHGLGCTERVWLPRAARPAAVSFGALLERDLGHAPLYVRYNTGLPVERNARALAALLEELHGRLEEARPELRREIVLVGHSMGGLVAQAAARAAAAAGHAWRGALTHLVALGAPHRAAPLERAARGAGHLLAALDVAGAAIPARLLAIRSAGVRDLGESRPTAGDLPVHRLAGTLTRDPSRPLARLLGDAIVGVPSALGGEGASAVVGGVSHLRLTRHPAVYAQLRDWVAAAPPEGVPRA